MGTNYYLVLPGARCRHCGHVEEAEIEHVGKASVGWHFQFNTTRVKTLADWRVSIEASVAAGGWISEERSVEPDAKVDPKEFWDHVNAKRTSPRCVREVGQLDHAVTQCVDGVDLCPYNFS